MKNNTTTSPLDDLLNFNLESLKERTKTKITKLLNEDLTMEEAKKLNNKRAMEKLKKQEEEKKKQEEVKLLKEKVDSEDVDVFLEGVQESLLRSTNNLKSIEEMESQVKDKLHNLEMAKLQLEEFLSKCSILKKGMDSLNNLQTKVDNLKEGVVLVKEHTTPTNGSLEDLDLSRWWGDDLTQEEKEALNRKKAPKALTSIYEAYDKVYEDKDAINTLNEQAKIKSREEELKEWDKTLEE